jgi:ATP/maltotriose-dependent transcriptional regulator MalT
MELTKRRREVVRLTSLGLTMDEIAKVMGISFATVDTHRSYIKKALGLRNGNAAQITRYALMEKITTLDDELSEAELAALNGKPARGSSDTLASRTTAS